MQINFDRLFGSEDHIFAGHPTELDEAWALLVQLRKDYCSWNDFEKELRAFMNQNGWPAHHIQKQASRAEKLFKDWLDCSTLDHGFC